MWLAKPLLALALLLGATILVVGGPAGAAQPAASLAVPDGSRGQRSAPAAAAADHVISQMLDDTPTVPGLPIVWLVARRGNQVVWSADPGETLAVEAQVDTAACPPASCTVQYAWEDHGEIYYSEGPTYTWTVRGPGTARLFLHVEDSRGGSSTETLSLITPRRQALAFSGRVAAAGSNAPVPGATVTVDTATETTAASGEFRVLLNPDTPPPYAVTVTHPDYATQWRVLSGAGEDMTFRLAAVRPSSLTPQAPQRFAGVSPLAPTLALAEDALRRRDGSATPLPPGLQVGVWDPLALDALPPPLLRDGQGDATAVQIHAALGVMLVQRSGEQAAVVTDQYVALPDSARVEFPAQAVAASRARAGLPGPLPDALDLLYYDEAAGGWEVNGQATLPPNGDAYVASVSHFSVWTVGELVNSACMVINVDPLQFEFPFRLRIAQPPLVAQQFLAPPIERLNGLYGLRPFQDVTLEMVHPTDDTVVFTTFRVSSGGVISSATRTPPFTECRASVTLARQHPPKPPTPAWLSFLTPREPPRLSTNADPWADSHLYYNLADPGATKTTLDDWLRLNGMKVNNAWANDVLRAVYFNDFDLKFGRNMRCRSDNGPPTTVFCAVTNYARVVANGIDPARPALPALEAAIAEDPALKRGTVAMEYSPVPGQTTPVVKFYVFDATDNLIPFADLDDEHEKPVPHMCLSCHGGIRDRHSSVNGSPPPSPDHRANFREFDAGTFKFIDDVAAPGSVSNDQLPFTRGNLQSVIDQLNAMVLKTNPAAAIQAHIQRLQAHDYTYVPTSWTGAGQDATYRDVVRLYCRSCHLAQPADINWQEYGNWRADRESIKDLACVRHVMPHAQVPWLRFWLSTTPSAPDALEASIGFSGLCVH